MSMSASNNKLAARAAYDVRSARAGSGREIRCGRMAECTKIILGGDVDEPLCAWKNPNSFKCADNVVYSCDFLLYDVIKSKSTLPGKATTLKCD